VRRRAGRKRRRIDGCGRNGRREAGFMIEMVYSTSGSIVSTIDSLELGLKLN